MPRPDDDAAMDTLQPFEGAARAVEASIASVEDWDAPGLGEWSVAELVAHLIRAADRITHYLAQPVDGEVPVCDRVEYFRFDHRAAATGVADRSRADAARIGTDALASTFTAAWTATTAALRTEPADRIVPTFMGPMTLEEYSATRVLELVVHGLDLCRALDVPERTDPTALAMTERILRSLLDGDMPGGLTGTAFVMAATGRDPHPDPRLPVLS